MTQAHAHIPAHTTQANILSGFTNWLMTHYQVTMTRQSCLTCGAHQHTLVSQEIFVRASAPDGAEMTFALRDVLQRYSRIFNCPPEKCHKFLPKLPKTVREKTVEVEFCAACFVAHEWPEPEQYVGELLPVKDHFVAGPIASPNLDAPRPKASRKIKQKPTLAELFPSNMEV